ncbi:MAG: Crossover junction endodeoxyribonuclease RuvC [Chlamydiae bacterium]|nr:Crossover junction endodeoxyribonuclease RuvC [Chlamydiota bacterium]
MIILGVDPGTRATGFAVIQHENNRSIALDFGTIKPSPKDPLEKKYYFIFTSLDQLIIKYQPKFVSVETQFVHKNVQSAIKLGMARGACLIAAAKNNISVHEYAPCLVKKAVVGKGHATKLQVQKMVQILLNLDKQKKLDEDASDALALAICHAHAFHMNTNFQNILRR